MMKRLLIKQVIGRTLLDSSTLEHCTFSLSGSEEQGWQIIINKVPHSVGGIIESLRSDLNLFYFEQDDANDESTLRKWWIYDVQSPQVEWEESSSTLRLQLSTRIAYSNNNV